MPLTLAIETSCDETAVALVDDNGVLKNLVSSQIKLHSAFGGVVPELAAREHVKAINILLEEIKNFLPFSAIDFVSFTLTPGLLLSLVVGSSVAKSLSHILKKPLVPVHHLEGHIYSPFLKGKEKPQYPFLGIILSGGHTDIYEVRDFGKYKFLGGTLDDSLGETFDKVARALGYPYPGGPHIDRLAQKGKPIYKFKPPKVDGLNFSFSGLKTQVINFIRKHPEARPEDVAASFQEVVASILEEKIKKAVEQTGIRTLAVVGGVSANSRVRAMLKQLQNKYSLTVLLPPMEYTTDNAAMIGYVGLMRFERKRFAPLDVNPLPNYPLEKFGKEWS